MKKKRYILFFTIFVVLVSALTINYEAGASISTLQINSVSSFIGQMEGSYFAKNGTLFAGDSNYNLFRSDDNGTSFRQVYSFPKQANPSSQVTGYMWVIFVDSRNYVFISIPGTNRLYRSTNFGTTFSQVLNTNGTINDGFYIALTEDSQGSLYAATYDNSISPPALLKSNNGGATWTILRTFAVPHLHSVKFNPADGYLYVLTGEWGSGYNNADCERMFRSKDNGVTWTTVINRPQEIQAEGNSVYLEILFNGNWVYIGTDQAFQPNWIDRFNDDGSNRAFTPQTVYNFPSDGNFPIIGAVWLNKIMLFSSTAEFSDGTSRIVASQDGLSWQIIKETEISQSRHHTDMLTGNPNGIAFFSDGPNLTYSITENNPQPTPTPTPTATPTTTATPTPTPTPNPNYLFTADFEGGNFNEYSGTSGSGTHSQTVETANPYLGSYNAKFTTGASSEGWAYHSITSSPVTYYRQMIKIGSLPTSGAYLYLGSIYSTNSQNTLDPFIYNNNGQYYWGTISVINGVFYRNLESTPSNPTVGKYYSVEVLRDVTNHKTDLWIDGNLRVDASRTHVGNSNLIATGISWADSAATTYVDCVRVKTSYIGPEPPQPTPTPTPTPTATPAPTPTPTPLSNAIQVSANVTVTAVSFDQTSATLNVTVVKNGTNYVQATISKTTLPTITPLKVYINSAQKTYTYTDGGTNWIVSVLTT